MPTAQADIPDRIALATIIYDEAQAMPREQAIDLIACRLMAAHSDGFQAGVGTGSCVTAAAFDLIEGRS